jgi:hypothetical protein
LRALCGEAEMQGRTLDAVCDGAYRKLPGQQAYR